MRDFSKDPLKFLLMPFLLSLRTFGNIKVHSYGEEMLEGVRLYLIQVEEMWEGAEASLTDLSVMSTGFLNDINCPLRLNGASVVLLWHYIISPGNLVSSVLFSVLGGIALNLLTPDSHMQLQRPESACEHFFSFAYFVSLWFQSLTSLGVPLDQQHPCHLACWKCQGSSPGPDLLNLNLHLDKLLRQFCAH